MRSLFQKFLWLAALSAATWLIVLWRWYAMQRVVSTGDAALYLLALPLALFAFVLAMRWAVLRGAAATQAAAESAAAASPARSGQADPAQPEAPGAWPLLGAWVHTPAGADVEALLAALAEGAPRPAPYAGLRDAEGLPVLSARIAALNVAAVEAALAAGAPAPKPSVAALRALAALAPLIEQALEPLREAPDTTAAPPDRRSRTPPPPRMHVLVAWPGTWSAAETEAAEGWLKARLQALAATLEPPCPWVLRPVSGGGVALLQEATRLLGEMQRQQQDGSVLVLACHSDLDDEAVQRLEREQRLFTLPKRPQGVMPGEAAGALLLASGLWADDATEKPGVMLRGFQAVQREPGSTAAERKAALADMEVLLAQSLADAGVEPADVASAACDAAQHANVADTLYALAHAGLPHLEPRADLRLVGTLCGHTGSVGPVLALAVAWGQCSQTGKPALALSVTDGAWGLVAALTPARTAPERP